MSEPITLRRARILPKWGLTHIPPFSDVPPKDNPARLARLFTGRRAELDRVILPLLDGRNVLVRGMWGVGKTTFILHTLHELAHQTSLINETLLPIYIDNFKGGTLPQFQRLVIFVLATALAHHDGEAKTIVESMRGVSISHKNTKCIDNECEIKLFTVASLAGEVGEPTETEQNLGLDNLEHWVNELLDRARQKYHHIVIAVDDLDKTDPKPSEYTKVRAMFDEALPLLRSDKCAFILTGRTLTVAQDIYGTILGIFHRQLQLHVLKPEELNEIAVKTLNLARENASDEPFPFTTEAITELASASYGIPRQFNLNCADILEAGIRLGYEQLDKVAFSACFADVQSAISADVEVQFRQLLYIAQKHGGFAQENRKALAELGWGDFVEVLPLLDYLVQRDLMVRQDYAGGMRFIVSTRAEKAARDPLF